MLTTSESEVGEGRGDGAAAWPKQEGGLWGLVIGNLLAYEVRVQPVAGRNCRALALWRANLRVELFLQSSVLALP